jgi:hypothetical protein
MMRWRGRSKGTTLLFLAGAMAVVMLLSFSLGTVTSRGFIDSHRARQRAQADWIARAGIVYATAHADELTTAGQIERTVGAGAFVCRLDGETTAGARALVCDARVPAERPAVTVTRRASLR